MTSAAVAVKDGHARFRAATLCDKRHFFVRIMLLKTVLVGVYQATYQAFTQTPVGVNDPLIFATRERVAGERNALCHGREQWHHHDRHP